MDTISADQVVEAQLFEANRRLSNLMKADVVSLRAPMMQPVDDVVRTEIEGIKEAARKQQRKLVVLVETHGGYAETVERIVAVFRRHYEVVEFIVPNYAYSAGTLLVMSGDEIYMDYYSVLGPIDPQYQADGDLVPGMGYLAKYQELVERVNSIPDGDEHKIRAELAILVRKFDPAKLFHIEQSIAHAKSLLRAWLPAYKFKDWVSTETNGHPVGPAERESRAEEIANVLGDARRWHSHGRGISIRELASEEIKLKIANFGDDQKLNHAVRIYHGLFIDFLGKRGIRGAFHSSRGTRRII